ncbi:hypothetical protein FE257_005364 [Aspergillus nanangensis]|uniref:AMP-dependent synthetase/ligase domain-containing protein n=1 Tax=Aspergillus nanangensis TaxID=2582783 RepID=A0AAD4CQE8_ASPNN|nr:hypothetical protein FE257_005364 [Aspergillus nanangensis]
MSILSKSPGVTIDDAQTITQHFASVVEQDPERLALVCSHQPADIYGLSSCRRDGTPPYLRWTYSSLSNAVDRLVNGLATNGITPGTPLFLFCNNQAEYIVATLAAFVMGLLHVPIDPGDMSKIEDIQSMANTVITHQGAEKVVVLVNHKDTADTIDLGLTFPLEVLKIICDGSGDAMGWMSLQTLLDAPLSSGRQQPPLEHMQEMTVFFTSGTTVAPKGCLINSTLWLSNLRSSLSLGTVLPEDRVAIQVPATHAFGFICAFLPLMRGSAIVFSGPKFAPQKTVDDLYRERCTRITMVPTMIHSLATVLETDEVTLEYLDVALFAAMANSPEVLKKCQKYLGVSQIENFYGMTEGVFVSTGVTRNMETIVEGSDVAIGRPLCGSEVRICAPDEQSPLPSGVPGEMHYSGNTMISSYMERHSNDFYEADGRLWFRTGDQVVSGTDDLIFFVGRYKDLIVRGGENITSAKIEAVLAQDPRFDSLQPQIVGATDAIAGEVPIAVVKADISNELAEHMRDIVRSSLGLSSVPTKIVPLSSLGLDDYPKTSLGKVQKLKLKLVFDRRQQTHSSGTNHQPACDMEIVHQVKEVWARVLGKNAQDIDITSPLSRVADSITMLIARDCVQKETDRSVSLPDWTTATTIQDQVVLLQGSKPYSENQAIPSGISQSACLGAMDMIHVSGNETAFNTTKIVIEEEIGKHHLTWDDVQSVTPCSDFLQTICRSRVINTWNIRTLIVTTNASTADLHKALKLTLEHNPLMLSFMIVDPRLQNSELGLYISIHSGKFSDQCVLDYGTVETLEDAQSINMDYPFPDHTLLPGPTFRALVVFVRETNSAAVITNNAIYLRRINEDIDRALQRQPLHPRVPFNAWADSYHTLRSSPGAETSINFHVEYLRDVNQHIHALWPHPTPQLTVSPERSDQNGHMIRFAAPSFVYLREKHPLITAPIILKAALALQVLSHTNHTHAVFLNLEANRSTFPFIPQSLAGYTPFSGAADVSGPTFSGVLNLISLHPSETVLDYLFRVQQDQAKLTAHANVPWYEVFRRLGLPANEVIPRVAESLIFNWMPGLGAAVAGENPFQEMTVAQTHIRTKLGMLASADSNGPDGRNIVLFLQGAVSNRSSIWVERLAYEWKRIALWLAAEDSWGIPVERFVDCFS